VGGKGCVRRASWAVGAATTRCVMAVRTGGTACRSLAVAWSSSASQGVLIAASRHRPSKGQCVEATRNAVSSRTGRHLHVVDAPATVAADVAVTAGILMIGALAKIPRIPRMRCALSGDAQALLFFCHRCLSHSEPTSWPAVSRGASAGPFRSAHTGARLKAPRCVA